MLVVVRKPPTEFIIKGNFPKKYFNLLKKDYGDNIRVEEDFVPATEMDWYKQIKAEETPGGNLKFYRKLQNFTQVTLAEKLGVSKQKISNMENGIIPISRKTAYKLSDIFRVPAGRFI